MDVNSIHSLIPPSLDPLLSNPLDPQQFTLDVAEPVMGAAQTGKFDIDGVCAIMSNMSKGTPLQRYAAVHKGRPLNTSISDRMAALQETDWRYLPTYVGGKTSFSRLCDSITSLNLLLINGVNLLLLPL